MLDPVAIVSLQTLRDLLLEEVKFLLRVDSGVKKVERDLRTIHGLLIDIDRKKSDSRALQNCIEELKDLAIKAENVLEKYAVELQSKRGKSLMKKLQRFIGILSKCCSVHHVGNEIDDIRSRLGELTNKFSSINGGEGPSNVAQEEQQRLLRLRYAHEIEQHFVGMEKDIEFVVSMVSSLSPKVISICGMGGLGKTTLARKIYHHQNVVGRFGGRRVWVCVTQQFEAKTVLREIFKQVDNLRAGIDGMESYELVRELHSVLEKNEWLIVIDDIWESPHWAILKPTFPMNCKVMLTTRTEKIDVASKEFRVHKLDFLSEDDGWELLRKIADPINIDDSSAACSIVSKPIEDEGRLIVQRCGRLPLAISVIGGILRQKQQILVEWKNVRSNIESYLKNGEGAIGNDIERVKLVLDLSFDVLPYYLKSCFLYLACFPEDHEIDTEELYLLWMAEGLISSEGIEKGETLRDVAQRYLTELVYRCMVQVEKGKYEFTRMKLKSCRLHDLMRDLCISKSVEKKFFKPIEISEHRNDISSIDRVAINLKDDDDTLIESRKLELEDLRSFLVLSRSNGAKAKLENIVNLKNSKHLKILVFRRFDFDKGKLPSAVSKLILLRYLGLYQCYVKELPRHVCFLPYMNTLDLRVGNDALKLPNLIWKMKSLRHLFLNNKIQVIGGDKLRLEGLNELETLVGISSETARIADVKKLMNLRLLSARIIDMDSLSKIVECMSSNHCKLHETRLDIEWCDFGSEEKGRSVVKKMLMSTSLVHLVIEHHCKIGWAFPSYEEGMCNNLVNLEIYCSGIGTMEELGKYPILQHLRLVGDQVEELRSGANSFPELKFLLLYEFLNLKKWEVEEGAMPKLQILQISRCSKLEKLPDALRFIPTLREVVCLNASSHLMGRMRRGREGEEDGEDYANFSHIPLIDIC